MSKIIKSANVSYGKNVDLDNPVVVKTSEIMEKVEKDIAEKKILEKKETFKTQEEIEEMYMEEARKKSELFFNTEMQKAYEEGVQRANFESNEIIENARREAERMIFEATQIKNNIANDYKKTMESMEKDILDLVLEVSQKVIAKEIKKPDYIAGIVTDALEKVPSKKDTILKVSEQDYDYIIENKDKIMFNVEGFGEVEVEKETSLENGSCLVETKFGIVDGSIKTRMNQIEQEVYKILNR